MFEPKKRREEIREKVYVERAKLKYGTITSVFKKEGEEFKILANIPIENGKPLCTLAEQDEIKNLALLMIEARHAPFRGNAYNKFILKLIELYNGSNEPKIDIENLPVVETTKIINFIPNKQTRERFLEWFEEKMGVPLYLIDKNDPFNYTNLEHWGAVVMAAYVKKIINDKRKIIDNPTIHPRGIMYIIMQQNWCIPSQGWMNNNLLVPSKSASTYNTIIDTVTKARYLGLIDPKWIVDSQLREEIRFRHTAGQKLGLSLKLEYNNYPLSYMQFPTIVVYVEKTNIDSILDTIAKDIPMAIISSIRGELSVSIAYKILDFIVERGKLAIVLMLTDFDPAGRLIALRGIRKLQGISVQYRTRGKNVPVIYYSVLGLDAQDAIHLYENGIPPLGMTKIRERSMKQYESWIGGKVDTALSYELDALWSLPDPVLYLSNKIMSLLPRELTPKNVIDTAIMYKNRYVEQLNERWKQKLGDWGNNLLGKLNINADRCNPNDVNDPCHVENVIRQITDNYKRLVDESLIKMIELTEETEKQIAREMASELAVEDYDNDLLNDLTIVKYEPDMENERDVNKIYDYYKNIYDNYKKMFDERYFGLPIKEGTAIEPEISKTEETEKAPHQL